MILTGARVSEACGMCWDAVDLERGIARVIRRVRWDQTTKHPFLEETTKTKESSRLLMLPDDLLKILKEMKQENHLRFLFTNTKDELLKYNAVQNAFNRAYKEEGIEFRSTHILRHTFATIALLATKNLSAVQASLGHTNSKMTQKYAKAIALLDTNFANQTAKYLNIK